MLVRLDQMLTGWSASGDPLGAEVAAAIGQLAKATLNAREQQG